MSRPKFSVVVPACARPAQLAECLQRLAPGVQTFPAAEYEVIVTDDSADASVRELVQSRFPWARWAAGPRRGPAANRNHGAAEAKFEWLVFTDDDCLPAPGWLAAFAEAIAGDATFPAWEGRTVADRPREWLDETAPLNTTGGYLWSCNLAVRRDFFTKLGGFDEDFKYASMEDVDFRERLLAANQRFGFAPDAEVCHPWRTVANANVYRRYRESFYIYLRKHPEMRARQQGRVHLRLAARELLREWPRFALRGHTRGTLLHFAKTGVYAGMGLRLLAAGAPPSA